MAIDISATSRRIVYTGSAGTGPYAFAFNILVNTDVAVFFNDTELTLTTDYTVSISADGTGSITLVVGSDVPSTPTASDRVTIVGDRTIQRTTDFTTGGPLFATSLNDELDSLTIFTQQNLEQSNRSLRAPNTDPTTVNMELPDNATRANKTLAFDANGDPVIGEQIGDYRGDWAASTSYNKRDLVKDTSTNNIFMANTAHTSSGSQPLTTNTDSAKWDLIVDAASATTSATNAAASATAAATSATAAQTAQTAAETAETNAETAETNAETAQTAAETAKTAAETAQTGAETAETNAGTSETNAATSATNAATSATSASSSASTATTKASEASTSATNAATSATTATTQATTATTQATTATTKASEAATSATNAATSATNATTSETNAATSATNAAASFDSFDDRYLGAKASDPTTDNDGDALITGALYFNSTSNDMRVYNGSAWEDVTVDDSTVVLKTSNTGAAEMPSGTTAQRDGSPNAGYLRFNSTTTGFEGYDGSAWGSIGGGASAGGAIYENTDEITADYTITTGSNGFSVGPMTIASGVSVTVPSGQRWVVL